MKLIFRIALITLITLGVIKTDRVFLKKPVFEIKDIKIEGASEKLNKSFEPLVKELIGKNINDINLSDIEKKISEDVRIKKVSVRRDSLSGILISVTEREAEYYLQYKNNIYILDRDGKIYGYLNDLKKRDFPFVVADSEEDTELILSILDKAEATDFKDIISQVYTKDRKLVNIVLSDGTVIKTDKDVNKEKYDTGSYLFFDLSRKKKIDYMDLRYEDYIIKYVEDKDGR